MTHPRHLLRQLPPVKKMGQNFIVNPEIGKMIVDRAGISKRDQVLEIGPGLGALTVPIARNAFNLVAVEKDSRLISLLEQELAREKIENVRVVNEDILKTNFQMITGEKRLVVMGNLPYGISSQILFRLVKERNFIEKAFLMFQKELAARIIALPGTRDYSRLSAVVQYAADIGFVADISPSCFFPRPGVDSSVLRFDFFHARDFSEKMEELLFGLIKEGFSKRRKSLKNSLAGGELGFSKSFVLCALKLAGINPGRRAETLTTEEFKTLTKVVWETGKYRNS